MNANLLKKTLRSIWNEFVSADGYEIQAKAHAKVGNLAQAEKFWNLAEDVRFFAQLDYDNLCKKVLFVTKEVLK